MSRDSCRFSSTRKSMVRFRSRGMAAEVFLEQRLATEHDEIGCEVAFLRALVTERKSLRVRLEEEVERVEHRHLGDQVHLDAELVGLLREDEPREVVRFRVLLPVDEVLGGQHLERIRQDAGAAMRRGTQADDLWAESNEPIVSIVRDVIERYMNGHDRILHRGLTCVFAPNCATGGLKAPWRSVPGQAAHFFERGAAALVFLGRALRNQ